MADHVGQQLGNYRLTRLLGRGGFAEVYLGEHVHLESQAAIKVLHTAVSGEYKADFLMEARRLVRLAHPHIVRLLDFGIEAEIPFLVMEYAPNGSLRTRHPKGSRVPLETIVSYVKPVAEALQYLHEQKLVHRDIKPENVLLGASQNILLSDFGIAVIAHTTGSIIAQGQAGTPPYMAPEQIMNLPRPASDQYALGIVVYEWLCGRPPFQGSGLSILHQHLHMSPPTLREYLPTISTTIESVVLKTLAKDPHQRFASVQDFATALEQAALSPKLSLPVTPSSQMPASPSPVTPPSRLVLPPPPTLAPGIAVPQPTATNSPRQSPAWPGYVISPSQLTPRSMVVPPLYTPRPTKHGISRRAVLVGLAGLAVVGGGISLLVHSQRPQVISSSFSSTPTPTPHPTPIPLGTLLYTYRGHTDSVQAVVWSFDGKRTASASLDKTVQVWDASDGGHVFTYRGHTDQVFTLAWSPNGKRLASGSLDNTVQVWDATDGGHVFIYRGHSSLVYAVAWSPDGKRIASASGDETVQVWDATDGSHVLTYRGHKFFASQSSGKAGYAVIWPSKEKHVFSGGGGVSAVAWSPNGQRIASGGGAADSTVQVWDAATGNRLLTYRGHSPPFSEGVYAVPWSPDGSRIASGAEDNTVQVWDAVDGGHVYTYRGHSSYVNAVAWSPDGKRIASGSYDKTVQVWDATDGGNAFSYRGHTNGVNAVAWSPDGKRIASGGEDTTVQVWQAV